MTCNRIQNGMLISQKANSSRPGIFQSSPPTLAFITPTPSLETFKPLSNVQTYLEELSTNEEEQMKLEEMTQTQGSK